MIGTRPATSAQRSASAIIRSEVPLNVTALSSAAVLPEQRAIALGEAAKRIVVMHHGLAIRRKLDVAFRSRNCGDRGFRRAGMFSMMPRQRHAGAVGHRPRR